MTAKERVFKGRWISAVLKCIEPNWSYLGCWKNILTKNFNFSSENYLNVGLETSSNLILLTYWRALLLSANVTSVVDTCVGMITKMNAAYSPTDRKIDSLRRAVTETELLKVAKGTIAGALTARLVEAHWFRKLVAVRAKRYEKLVYICFCIYSFVWYEKRLDTC